MVIPTQFPQSPTSPLVDLKTGMVTVPWQNFFISLWNRTGGGSGSSSFTLDSLGTPSLGATLFRGASVWQFLHIGTNGQLYTVGPGSLPQWESLSALIDQVFGSLPGSILYRDPGGNWTALPIGLAGMVMTVGPSLIPHWTDGLLIDANKNIVPGSGALLTTATDGFIYTETCAGVPTGIPTSFSGRDATVYDTTNHLYWIYDTATGAWRYTALLAPTQGGVMTVRAAGVNFNAANSDTSIPIQLPPGISRYQLSGVFISGASATLNPATCGVFSASGGGGTAVVTGGTAVTVTASAENTNNNMQTLSAVNAATESYNFSPLFFRVQTASGGAATATVTVQYLPLS